MTSPKWYDITLKADPTDLGGDYDEIMSICRQSAEKYGFQLEQGKGGYMHWQIRVCLKKGAVESVVRKMWSPGHVSPTSAQGRNFEYVTKSDTSIGYRYCTEVPDMDVFEEQIKGDLLDWQVEVNTFLECQSNRGILCVQDFEGCHGKTWFTKWLVWHKHAQAVPKFEESKDMVAVVYANPKAPIYIFDLPRAEGKGTQAMWSAIEQIKNGHVYDKRNTWKEKWIKPPKILVFTNSEINPDELSTDRWTIKRFEEDSNNLIDIYV